MTIIVTLHLRRMTVLMMSSILQLIETFSQTHYHYSHHLPGDNGSDMTLMTLRSEPQLLMVASLSGPPGPSMSGCVLH